MKSESVNPNTRFEELVESYINGSITEEQSKELLDIVRADDQLREQFANQLQLSQLLDVKEGDLQCSVADSACADLVAKLPVPHKEPKKVRWQSVLYSAAAVLAVLLGISHIVDYRATLISQEYHVVETNIIEPEAVPELVDLSKPEQKSEPGLSEEVEKMTFDMKVDSPDVNVETVDDSPTSPQPQEFDTVISVKSPIVLKNVYGSTRNTGTRGSSMAEPVVETEQFDYTKDDLKVVEVPAGEGKTSASLSPAPAPDPVAKKPAPPPSATAKPKVAPGESPMVPLKIKIPKPQFTGTPKDIRSANLERPGSRAGAVVYEPAPDPKALHPEIIQAPHPVKRADPLHIMPPAIPTPISSGESYAKIEENEFLNPLDKPLSTFSIDVDTASYANLRRMLVRNGRLPPAGAIRIEEMINYFDYNYEGPVDEKPFSSAMSMHACPWNKDHSLLRVGLQGRRMDENERKPSNLVFLLDVSGSMNTPDKLPLLKKGMIMLVNALNENDRVAIVVYAGNTGLVLDSTSAAKKDKIIRAMERLSAGGSTAGGAGIELAYTVAAGNFIKGGVNRVILATDGDFNVGVSSHGGLEKLIEKERASGIFLSVLGFGTGNLQDSKMELLANKGNGNYFYIDSEREAQKVLVKQLNGTLVTIAKDVKIQVEFNPEHIKSYRLIGYENRKMAARDFADDKKDAGEIGAGHQVTALYEIVPVGAPDVHDGVSLKYGKKAEELPKPKSNEMLTLKLRYKAPDGDVSKLLEFPYTTKDFRGGDGDESFRWAAAVAAFGQIMRGSQFIGKFSVHDAKALALSAKGEDSSGYRAEFVKLIECAALLIGEEAPVNEKGYPLWKYRR